MAGVQLREILRAHSFWLFIPVATLVVLAAPSFAFFTFDREVETAVQLGLSTASLFAMLLGLSAGAGAVARDRETATKDILFARSLSSVTYVVGKWLGIVLAVLLAVSVLGAVHLLALLGRGGAPLGPGPILGALLAAVLTGALAAAAALLFSTVLRPGAAFVVALLFVLLSHVVPLLPEGALTTAAENILPRLPWLHLGVEAAFGPWSGPVFYLAVLHALLYAALLLAVSVPLAARCSQGKT